MRRSFGILLFPLMVSACGPTKEREPNDDFASATPIRAGKVEGRVASPKDVDVFRLDVGQDGILSVHVGGIRDADFVLSVQDKDHRELKRADETASGGDEEVQDVGLRPGPHFIVLSNKNEKADNPAQAYVMEVRVDKPVGRESEPDDTPQAASRLELPGVTRGHYWPSRNLLSSDTDYLEADWYRIDVQTGVFLLNIDVSDVPKVDPVMEVYDSNFYKVKEVDSGGVGAGESLKNFGVRGPSQYLLRLVSKYRTGNADLPYEILTELIPYQGRSEFEPNDQRQDATPFEGEAIAGTVAPAGDADWYKVTVKDQGRQILRASVTGLDGMDLTLDFRDALGNPVSTADNMGKGQPEVLTGLGVTQGEYYLTVAEKTGRKADSRETYTLTKTLVPFQAGLEYELNDSTASAQALRVGESVDGTIAPKGDADFYQFNVYQKGTVLFELAGVLNVQFVATLYDQEYRELETRTAPKPGESLSFDKGLEAGTYLLRLKAAGAEQNNVRDKYSLRLKAR